MREIKFRAWDSVKKNMMFAGEFPVYYEEDNGFHSGWSGANGDWDSHEIMMWTGLHDKNGTPIYESDIVEFTDKWEWYRGEYWAKIQFAKDDEERKAVMDRYENEPMERRVVEIDISEGVNFSTYDLEQGRWEVIGNIYQHPELINRR